MMDSAEPRRRSQNHREYSKLMAGAHRRKVTPLGSPSLIRHQAFWDPVEAAEERRDPRFGQASPQGAAAKLRTPEERNTGVDDLICAIYRKLKALEKARIAYLPRFGGPIPLDEDNKKDGTVGIEALFGRYVYRKDGRPAPPPDPEARPDPYRSVKISFFWRGFAMTLSFESHIEFVTMTATIDMSEKREIAGLANWRAQGLHDEIVRTYLRISSGSPASREQNKKLHDAVYGTIWSQFDREVLARVRLSRRAGERFVDFRGLVVEPRKLVTNPSTDNVSPAGSKRELPGEDIPLFTQPYQQARWQSGFNRRHPAQCDLDALEQVHPFLKCTLPDDTEFSVSRMLCGRAFLAAALGKQSGMEERPEPLTYFIYEDTLNAWQLGRLVYRINRAGTARIAATIHFDEMRVAGEALRVAANHLERALSKPGAASKVSRGELKESMDELRDQLRGVDSAVSRLPGKAALDGNLFYRIERSKYYQSQFQRVARSLRIGRVEGYQQYDEFVEQRIGPAFEYIQRLGGMYERVQRDRALLLRRLQSEDALFEEKQISRFQETAEIALFLILGPYYVGSVADHIIGPAEVDRALWFGALIWGVGSFAIYRAKLAELRYALLLSLFLMAVPAYLIMDRYDDSVAALLSRPPTGLHED